MPAKSQAQQALMAIAKNNPSKVKPENRRVLQMSKKQLGDFASTSTKSLPKHTEPDADERGGMSDMDADDVTMKKSPFAKIGKRGK